MPSKTKNGSPMIKSVLQVKFKRSKALPAIPMPKTLEIHEMSSQHCTVDQDTFVSDELNSSNYPSPEFLRDADHAAANLQYYLEGTGRVSGMPRSPAIDGLNEFFKGKAKSCNLLGHPDISSSSCSDLESNVLTSTINSKKPKPFTLKNISGIKTRKSVDPRLSDQPHQKQLASTPISKQEKVNSPSQCQVEGFSISMSSIHSSDAGGSMLVPRVEREMLTEDRIEETEDHDVNGSNVKEDATRHLSTFKYSPPSSLVLCEGSNDLYSMIQAQLSTLSPPTKNVVAGSSFQKAITPVTKSTYCSSKSTTFRLPVAMTSPLPEGSKSPLPEVISSPLDHKGNDDTHLDELSVSPPDVSFVSSPPSEEGSDKSRSKMTRVEAAKSKHKTSSASSIDTSGEIFSAVVHRKLVSRVIPYTNTVKQGAKRIGRKKFKLASKRQTVSPKLSLFSPEEYYKGARASEQMFDEIMDDDFENIR